MQGPTAVDTRVKSLMTVHETLVNYFLFRQQTSQEHLKLQKEVVRAKVVGEEHQQRRGVSS